MARNNFDQTGLGSNVKLGKAGSRIKSSDGAIVEARNNADDAFAIVRADHPVNDNDVVTKKYLETRADVIVTGQIDGGTPPAAGTPGRIFMCTTAGGTYVLGTLYRDTGSEWEALSSVAGMTIAVTTALTGGTIEFENDSKYIWDADTSTWKFIGASVIAEGVQSVHKTLSFTDTGTILLKEVPAGSIITNVIVIVTQVFDGTTPGLTIGDSVDPDRLLVLDHVDLTALGVYQVIPGYLYGAETVINTTLTTGGSPSTGQMQVVMEYSK